MKGLYSLYNFNENIKTHFKLVFVLKKASFSTQEK